MGPSLDALIWLATLVIPAAAAAFAALASHEISAKPSANPSWLVRRLRSYSQLIVGVVMIATGFALSIMTYKALWGGADDSSAIATAFEVPTPTTAASLPTPTAGPPPTPTPVQLPVLPIEVEWPTSLDVGESSNIRVTYYPVTGPRESAIVTTPGNSGALFHMEGEILRTSLANIDAVLGADYRLHSVVATLGAASFDFSPIGTSKQPHTSGPTTWEWNLSTEHKGEHVVNLRLDGTFRPGEDSMGSDEDVTVGLWRTTLRLTARAHTDPWEAPWINTLISSVSVFGLVFVGSRGVLGRIGSEPSS